MKKLALALIAALLLFPAFPTRAAMLSEYVDQTFATDEQDGYNKMEKELLPILKEVAGMMDKELDNMMKKDYVFPSEKFEAVWQKADDLLAPYTKEIADEVFASCDADDFEELNIQFRAELSDLFEQNGEKIPAEQLNKIDFSDMSTIKNIINIISLYSLFQEFANDQKFTEDEMLLISVPLLMHTLNKLQNFIPVDPE